MSMKDSIIEKMERNRDLVVDINDKLWEFAETRFEEFKSAELLCKALLEKGFAVEKGIADMDTAFVAGFGSGRPVIGILGEYDALYGLSQTAGIAEKKPLTEGGKGHGCGHHALGAGALAAAIAVKEYLEENKIRGTVRYYGCPGEEGGSGKAYMARAGCFQDVDVALTWHPGSENSVTTYNFLATNQVYFKFHGISSHAAYSPQLGRSALDAVELMNVGVNYLREHVIPEARIHYAVTNTGGRSPNVVQSEAEVLYLVRAPKLTQVKEIFDRVVDVAKGAALMTGTGVEIAFDRASSELLHNRALEKLIYDKFVELGPVAVEEKDLQFAREIRKTFTQRERNATGEVLQMLYGDRGMEISKRIADKEIVDLVFPFMPVNVSLPASTDMCDVSWNAPGVQFMTTCFANNTPMHAWQAVAQGKSELCHKGVIKGGEIMALAAVELIEKPELLKKIIDEFKERLGGRTYVCPIPAEIKPPPRR